jgi:hypothetical protein
MTDDRRNFFKKAAGAAVALASADTLFGATERTARVEGDPSAAATRPVSAQRFSLELEGVKTAGAARSFEGGGVSADVIQEPSERERCSANKHLGPLKYEPITLECGTGMSAGFYDWIEAFTICELRSLGKAGAIVAADLNNKEMWRITFDGALITEFTIPAADGASKEPAFLTLKFAPASTRRLDGEGGLLGTCAKTAPKVSLRSSFRLAIDGLDCTKVSKVGELTIEQTVITDDSGRRPGNIQFPNLVVTLPDSNASSFYKWHEGFLINGDNGPENEKNGTLKFLSPTLAVLFTVRFEGLGIFRLATDKMEANGEAIKRVTAEMYCRRMTFEVAEGVAAC